MKISVSPRYKGPIHLCFITDESYVLPTAVAIESLKVNRSPSSTYEIHIICRDVSQSGIERLRAVAGSGVAINIIDKAKLPIDEEKISLVRHVSPAAVFKFFIPDLLPKLDRVIYLDSDILIQGDFQKLWQTDVDSVYAAVVKDNQTITGRENHLKWLDFKHESYFNSGVMLLNLALMRQDGISAQLVDYRINGRNRFMDQDALNVVFGERVVYLPLKYNCLNWLFLTCTIEQLRTIFAPEEVMDTPEANYDRAIVLHMGGSEKPWLHDQPYYTDKYLEYARRIGWEITFPRVSVVIPVFNAMKHLSTCLDSLLAQTMKDIDIICVDNGSSDGSYDLLQQYAERDSRVRVFSVTKKGAGTCRNFGIAKARGLYVGFVDSDDFVEPHYFQSLYDGALRQNADVCMTSSVRECDESGKPGKWKALGVSKKTRVVSVKDRGDLILASGVTWNKIYRNRYLVQNKIHYSELPSAGEDKVFDYGMLLTANCIAVIKDATYFYRQSGTSESFRRKGRESFAIIGFYREIKQMLDDRPMKSEAKARWRNILKRARDAEFRMFANRMDPELRLEFIGRFVEEFYDDAESTRQVPGLIVSLTSFPARITTVHRTIKTILGQSVRPEKVVLWLTEEEFPVSNRVLPPELTELEPLGLEVRWCHNIRSYCKLIPTLKAYPDKVIVTADDDILYPRYWLEKLWQTYQEFPSCIIAHRVRKIKSSLWGLKPYNTWPILTNSMQKIKYLSLLTGVGGVLYPPRCFIDEVFNEEVFTAISPLADDLWFWAMSVLSHVEVKQVYSYESTLNIIGGSQTVSLSESNVVGQRNDGQLRAILKRYPEIMDLLRHELRLARRQRVKAVFHGLGAAALAPFRYFRQNGFVQGVRRWCGKYLTIKAFRYASKQFVPYGLMCRWLTYKYGIVEDVPLFYYPSWSKRIRRIFKFMLPYGLIKAFRRHKYGD